MKTPIDQLHLPSLVESIAPFLILISLFALGSVFLSIGESMIVVSMLGAACVAGITAVRFNKNWDDIQNAIVEKIALVFPIMMILLAIGGLIGAWMSSGTIPAFVWIGLNLIDPSYIVLTAFLASALMSIFTGTSWGSAGTVGVALIGVAIALDVSLAPVAGAVVSGAYFGDKMSPLSDTTNVSALAAGADLYAHIRHMLYTSIPSFIIAALVYTFLAGGGVASTTTQGTGLQMARDIEGAFKLDWFVYIPPVIVLIAIWQKWPAVLGIAASAAVAAFIGVVGQGFGVGDVLTALTNGFNAEMVLALHPQVGTFSDAFQSLVNRGGVYSMVNTFVVIITAFILAGTMEASGALKVVVDSMLKAVTSVFTLVAATMAGGIVMLSLTSHGGVSALLIGGVFQDGYKQRNLAPVNLSRSLQDSITIIDPLLPWTVSGVFMANTLGVPTLEYLPWAIFCFAGPIFSLFFAKVGFGMKKIKTE